MRILIVTASMGAGHTVVAAELARRLRACGARVDVADLLRLAGRSGDRLRHTYRLLLAHTPWLYDGAMRFWRRHPAPMEWLTARGAGPVERGLLAAVEAAAPDLVVSTYNLASQALGRLTTRHALRVPVVTLVTDPGPHPYWIGRGVAAHIVPLPETASALAAAGADRVLVAPPVVRPQFVEATARSIARRELRLPDGRLALVSAGSWAAGRVRATVDALRVLPDTVPIVLCGQDERLRRDLARWPGVRAVGWTDRVPAYLAAADVVVDNAGGLTCWEALVAGARVVMCDPLPGHGRLNACTLAAAGLVRVARDHGELARLVADPRPSRPPALAGLPAEQQVLRLAGADGRATSSAAARHHS